MKRPFDPPSAGGREQGITVSGFGISYGSDENVLNLILVMVVQL